MYLSISLSSLSSVFLLSVTLGRQKVFVLNFWSACLFVFFIQRSLEGTKVVLFKPKMVHVIIFVAHGLQLLIF